MNGVVYIYEWSWQDSEALEAEEAGHRTVSQYSQWLSQLYLKKTQRASYRNCLFWWNPFTSLQSQATSAIKRKSSVVTDIWESVKNFLGSLAFQKGGINKTLPSQGREEIMDNIKLLQSRFEKKDYIRKLFELFIRQRIEIILKE